MLESEKKQPEPDNITPIHNCLDLHLSFSSLNITPDYSLNPEDLPYSEFLNGPNTIIESGQIEKKKKNVSISLNNMAQYQIFDSDFSLREKLTNFDEIYNQLIS